MKNDKKKLKTGIESVTRETFAKYWIYGIICLNAVLLIISLFFSVSVAFGVLLGTGAAILKVWSFLEQVKKLKKENRHSGRSGFFVRYLIDASFLGMSGFFSIQVLIGCFLGSMAMRWVVYLLSFTYKNGGIRDDPEQKR